jgi:hypothetical protein
MPKPFMHYCVVPSGDMAGNKHAQEVTSFDIEYDQRCEVCGERLAPDLREIVAHIYEQNIEQMH